MKYYRNNKGNFFAYDDGRETPNGMTELTNSEVEALLSPADRDWSAEISSLYVEAMTTLKNGYTQSEIDTFPMKQAAIDAYYAGVSTVDNWHLSYLSDLEGATGSESSDELDNMILSRADKIKASRNVFWSVSSKFESLRNKYYEQLVEGQDNSAVVNSLRSEYVAIGAIIE